MFGIRVCAIGVIATIQVVAKPASQRGMRNSSVVTREQSLDTSALQAVPALYSPTVTVTTPGPHTDKLNVLSTAAPATGQTVEGGGHTVVRRPTLTEILMALPKDSTIWTRHSAKVEPESVVHNTLFAYDQ